MILLGSIKWREIVTWVSIQDIVHLEFTMLTSEVTLNEEMGDEWISMRCSDGIFVLFSGPSRYNQWCNYLDVGASVLNEGVQSP